MEKIIEEVTDAVKIILKQKELDVPNVISLEEPIFGENLGLNSLDSISLLVVLEEKFNIFFNDEELAVDVFKNIKSLSEAVVEKIK